MPQYVFNPVTPVEARHFTGDLLELQSVVSWVQGEVSGMAPETVSNVHFTEFMRLLSIDIEGRLITVDYGDYVILKDGQFYRMTENLFEALYSPAV